METRSRRESGGVGQLSSNGRTSKDLPSNSLSGSNVYQLKTANIMFDPRVVRGNTWSAASLNKLRQGSTKPGPPFTQTRKKRVTNSNNMPISTPRPVEGRQHIELQTDGYLDDVVEATNWAQTEPEMSETALDTAVPGIDSLDACTQIEAGDLPEVEEQQQAKSAQEASYWAAIEEEQQAAMQRQLALLQAREEELRKQQDRVEEEERARTAVREKQESEQYAAAAEHLSYKTAYQFTAGLMDIATGAARTEFLHQDADNAAVEVAEGLANAAQRMDLGTLMYAAKRDMRTFSIRSSARFEAMLVALSNGVEVPEEEIEQVLRRQTL